MNAAFAGVGAFAGPRKLPGADPYGGSFPPSLPPSSYDPGQVKTPPPIDIQAQNNPGLEKVQTQSQEYLDRLKEGSGFAFDVAGQKAREAAEGGRKALMQANALAGRPTTANLAGYDAGTQRSIQGALADSALGREEMYGRALNTAELAARGTVDAALNEKRLGLDSWQAQANAISATNAANMAAQQTAWQQMMALLQAQRSSPLGG